jgi:multiple sugar transport system permease protein
MTSLETTAPTPKDREVVSPEPPARTPAPPSRRRVPVTVWRILYFTLLGLAVTAFVYPLVWLVSASLKPKDQVFDNRLIPETVHLQNFVEVWSAGPVLRWLLNSVGVGLMAAITVTLSSALVAFGFAFFRFRFRGPLFGLVLATMMLPGAATMIPVYLIWNNLGMVNTQVPLWAQNLFGSAFYIFLLRQFFLGVPRELFEAARVDGCSFFGLFWRIAVPLCRPALLIVFVFELQASWSDLMKPLIYLQSQDYYTMPRAQADRGRLCALRRVPLGDRHGGQPHRHHPDDRRLRLRAAILPRRPGDHRTAGVTSAGQLRSPSATRRSRTQRSSSGPAGP